MLATSRLRLIILLTGSFFFGLVLQWLLPQLSGLIVVVAIMLLYVVYLSAVLIVKRRRQQKVPLVIPASNEAEEEPQPSPAITVVVPAHNEAGVIEETVRNLLQLDYPDFTVLVMDDRSQDGTRLVLEKLTSTLNDDRFQFHTREANATPGKSAVLNESVELTTSPLLAIFDADARVASDFLQQLVSLIEEPSVAAVQAQKRIANHRENLLTRSQQYEYTFDAHLQACRDMAKSAVELRGNGQLVKREAIEAVGGWNEQSVTDDLDLSTRFHIAGWDIRFAPNAVVCEEGITDFWSLVRQRCRWAEGSLQRYLDFGGEILFSRRLGLRNRADMLGYVVNFLFPLWIATDYTIVTLSFLTGTLHLSHALLSVFIGPIFTVCFLPTLYHAIRRFGGSSRKEAYIGSALTGIYMAGVWMPVVYYTVVKALFFPSKQLSWAKTEHKGH